MARPTTRTAHLLPLIEHALADTEGWRPSPETVDALASAARLLRRDMSAVTQAQTVRDAAATLGVHLRSLQEWSLPSRPSGTHRHRARGAYTGTDAVVALGLARVEVCPCGAQRATEHDGTRGPWVAPAEASLPRAGRYLTLSPPAWRSVGGGADQKSSKGC